MSDVAPNDPTVSSEPSTIFVRRLRVRGFRSLADCDIRFGPLTILVGFNASGKSNVLDALRFVVDALTTSPAKSVTDRGGIEALLHRSADSTADSFTISLDLDLRLDTEAQRVPASYTVQIGPDDSGEFPMLVLNESWTIRPDHEALFPLNRRESVVSRLRLPVRAAEEPDLSELESALRSMEFYDLNTASLRSLDESTAKRSYLGRTGGHLGRVLDALDTEDPPGKERLDGYLSSLIPGALGIDQRKEGRYSTVEARFRTKGDGPVPAPDVVEVFPRESLSEGTLRAAGVLAALLQRPAHQGWISLVGIEEPETALHPANVGALYEAMDDAAGHTQVIVTTQSSALLDSEYASLDHLLVVESIDGASVVGEIDQAGKEIVKQGLMTISQLHASGQMRPRISPGSWVELARPHRWNRSNLIASAVASASPRRSSGSSRLGRAGQP